MALDTKRLDNLRRAIEKGKGADVVARAITERGREIVIDSWSGVYPPASQAGQPPAIRTGNLSRSIRAVKISKGHWQIVAGGGIVDYAQHLEYGTSRMAARPFIRPATEKAKREADDIARKLYRVFIYQAVG